MNIFKPICFLFFLFSLFVGTFISNVALASDAQMKETLVRIIDQLETIKPLIARAKKEQPKNPRVKVTFDKFKGEDGKWHNGLRQDIEIIQRSLVRIVNQEIVEPCPSNPIDSDFIEGVNHAR